ELLGLVGGGYGRERVLLSAAGKVRHDELVDVVSRTFGVLSGATGVAADQPPVTRPGLTLHHKPLEQVHICLGAPGIAHANPDRYAAHLLSQALGGGMSSRLFQEAGERRGKASSAYSFLPTFRDTRYLRVYV